MIKIFAPNPPVYEQPGRHHVRLLQDHLIMIGPRAVWIPSGYVCDGASIPRLFWPVVGRPLERNNVFYAIPHDFLYLTHIASRSLADEVLFQLALQAGESKWEARKEWAAVRVAGAGAYRNTEEDEKDLIMVKAMIAARSDRDKFNLWTIPA